MSRPDHKAVWFLLNGTPVPGSRKHIPAGATHTCHDGDLQWTPLPGRVDPEHDWIGRDFDPRWDIVSWEDFANGPLVAVEGAPRDPDDFDGGENVDAVTGA